MTTDRQHTDADSNIPARDTDLDAEHLQAATEWMLRLREPDLSPTVIAEWMQWHDASIVNQDAFARVQSFWQSAHAAPLRPVTDKNLLAGDGYTGDIPVEEWLERAELPNREKSEQRLDEAPLTEPRQAESSSRLHILRRSIPWAAAAGVVIAVLIIAAPWRTDLIIETAKGANRDVTLPDGSRVVLGADSALTPAYTADRRMLYLERGEAFFTVKADKSRPFVVVTSSLAVTAVGTVFNVRTDNDVLRVTVAEGTVDVGPSPVTTTADRNMARIRAASFTPVRLRAGQQVTVGEDTQSATPIVSTVDPQLAAAWVTGTLQFRNEPLSSVVAAVNRYSPTVIEVQQDSLGDLRYTGTVVTDRIDEWLAALPNAFPLDVAPAGPDRMIIRSRD